MHIQTFQIFQKYFKSISFQTFQKFLRVGLDNKRKETGPKSIGLAPLTPARTASEYLHNISKNEFKNKKNI